MQGNATWKLLRAPALCLLLAACTGGGEGEGEGGESLDAAQRAKAQEMLQAYEAARTAGNPEVAEAAADKLREKYSDSEAARGLEPTLGDVRAAAEKLRETRRLQGLWDYQANAVEGGTQRSASVFSRTVEVGEDQPAPIPDGQLVLRDHPSWGRSAYLLLQQKKFDCGKPCKLRIAFDGGASSEWAGKQADSGKGPALFVEDEKAFIEQMEKAREVRMELPKGSGNIPALVFEVGGYQPARYANP